MRTGGKIFLVLVILYLIFVFLAFMLEGGFDPSIFTTGALDAVERVISALL